MSQSRHDVLTIEAAAERLQVSVATLESWTKTRGFPLCCVTKHARYVVWGMVIEWLGSFVKTPPKEKEPEPGPNDGRGIGPAPRPFPKRTKPPRRDLPPSRLE